MEEELTDKDADQSEFEKYNPLIHSTKGEQLLTRTFLKKYLAYAKTNDSNLTDESSTYITRKWTELRTKDFEFSKTKGASRVLPVTVRTLESLIRLATAHAKLRLSPTVDIEDCDAGVNLLYATLFEDDKEEQ